MLEDARQFDEAVLTRHLESTHPEVRRRAVVAVARIVNPRGHALLANARADADPEIVATAAFAAGQLGSPGALPWLGETLLSPKTPPVVAKEAAIALGKIRTPDARATLQKYLTSDLAAAAASAPVVGEALLSIGRYPPGDDIAPIVKWTTSGSAEVRWRATWALNRPRDPASLPHLLKLADDPSGDVRYWAMRGLAPIAPPAARGRGAAAVPTPPPPPSLPLDPAIAAQHAARLRAALKDPDRRVRTEALRALGGYDDDAAFEALVVALESPDTWLSVSAAEAVGRKASRAAVVVPKLVAAADPKRTLAQRLTALTPLAILAPDAAIEVASALVRVKSTVARTAAVQALQRLGDPGRARLDALATDPALKGLIPADAPTQAPGPTAPVRTLADYRRIVERWVVPDYNGSPRPRTIWTTPRGEIEIELYAGDAPLAVEYLVGVVETGAIVGTEFGRLVPNFVAQQRAIVGAVRVRDEVNRHGLTRANLSWASAGLDTGRPGYTLGHTPQPHNEGNFTALGRVIRGMDAVDRLELGDAVTAARMRR